VNKAFTKEDDGSTPERLPDLPISPHPNHVTPRGLAMLQGRKEALDEALQKLRADREFVANSHAISVAERDLRYVEARLATAILVTPPTAQDGIVRFGAQVVVADEDGAKRTYEIVGDDEAAPTKGKIAAHSPLARALMEQSVGDVVEWAKPGGAVELEICAVRYPPVTTE